MAYQPIVNPLKLTPNPSYFDSMIRGFQGAQEAVNTAYKPKTMAEALLAAQLQNKINQPKADDAANWYGAQLRNLEAQTGLYGAQQYGAKAPYLKLKMIQDYLNGGASDANSFGYEQPLSGMESYSGIGDEHEIGPVAAEALGEVPSVRNTFPARGTNLNKGQPIYHPTAEQLISGMEQSGGVSLPDSRPISHKAQHAASQNLGNYIRQALMQSMLGMGQPKIIENNGSQYVLGPNGPELIMKGQTAFEKNLSTADAKHAEELQKTVMSSDAKRDVLDELSAVTSTPLFQDMRKNPLLNQYELKAFSKIGTPEQQQAIGKVTALMGDLVKSSSRDFSGQFRVGEQQLLNEMKPSLSDTIPVMQGKLEAWSVMLDMMTKRSELEAGYIRENGMSPLKARIAANKAIDTKQIRKRVDDLIHPKPNSKYSHLSDEDLQRIMGAQ